MPTIGILSYYKEEMAMHTPNKNNHKDDSFRATVILPTAMTYSVGSSSSMSDFNVGYRSNK